MCLIIFEKFCTNRNLQCKNIQHLKAAPAVVNLQCLNVLLLQDSLMESVKSLCE